MNTKGLVYFDEKNSLQVDWDAVKGWAVKNPKAAYSLKRKDGGSCSFDMGSYHQLANKKGIFFIDMVLKSYIFFPAEVLKLYQPEAKTHMGMPKSLYVYSNLKRIVTEQNLEIIPFGKVEIPLFSKPASDVRSKFGI